MATDRKSIIKNFINVIDNSEVELHIRHMQDGSGVEAVDKDDNVIIYIYKHDIE